MFLPLDIGRFVMRILQQARGVVTKEWDEFYREVKALPITEELKAKYQEVRIAELTADPQTFPS